MKAIQTEHLTKYYGKSRGIVDLSLSVEQGAFYGFIGPNGAGKSTTIRTLLGLITPTEGAARVLGHDIRREKQQILSQVGYLPSEIMFYSGMRVKDVLRFSADLHKKDCREEAQCLCSRLELDPNRKVEELSLGNRKKVGIVCALQHKPMLYIMDEPTSGLDPLMQREFFELLKERNRDGATVFLSSHVLSEVQKYCTHAAVIREGRLLISDSVENLGHTEAKRVTAWGVRELPEIDHAKDVKQLEDGISFLYDGKPAELMRKMAELPIRDITITEPDLEEIFLHYYEKEETCDDGL